MSSTGPFNDYSLIKFCQNAAINGKHLFDTHDVALRDKDGDYQILGRADDVIRYHGELLNLPKIEGAAVSTSYMSECSSIIIPTGFNVQCIFYACTFYREPAMKVLKKPMWCPP